MALETTTDVSSKRLIPPRGRAQTLLRRAWSPALLVALVAGSLVVHARHLGHSFIAPWDESIHAVVAEHLALHPLRPTLYETAAIPQLDPADWTHSHIWLHIPPFGLWAAGLSMRLLGTTPLALRLPDLLFGLVGMVAIYVLGRRLYGPVAGLIAAAFVGFAPYPLLMSQGYVFGDITDVPLVALTPLAVLALTLGWKTGRRRWLVAGGVFLGLCYLCKGALGIAPAGVAGALYLADWIFPREEGWHKIGLRGLAWFFGAAIMVALPYNLYIAHAYPVDYKRESGLWIYAFFHNYESWGMPPDGHLTSWLYQMYGAALALLLVSAMVVLAVLAVRHRSRADVVPVIWALTLYLPLSIAVSKAPPMTFGAFGAFGLALGRMLTRGIGSRSALARAGTIGLLLGAAGTALTILVGHLPHADMPYATVFPYSPVLFVSQAFSERARPYAVELVLSGAAAFAFVLLDVAAGTLARWRRNRDPAHEDETGFAAQSSMPRHVALGPRAAAQHDGIAQRVLVACAVALAALVLARYWLGYDMQASSARTVSANNPVPSLGAYLEHELPANATVLIPSNNPVERAGYLDPYLGRLELMFYAHRDVDSLDPMSAKTVCQIAAETARVGSQTVVFTDAHYDGTVIGRAHGWDGWTIYAPRCG